MGLELAPPTLEASVLHSTIGAIMMTIELPPYYIMLQTGNTTTVHAAFSWTICKISRDSDLMETATYKPILVVKLQTIFIAIDHQHPESERSRDSFAQKTIKLFIS
jgi:hypothetical protein